MNNKTNSPQSLNSLVCFNYYSGWREVEQLFRQIVGNDMTPQKSYILSFLFEENRTVSEISRHLNLDTSAVSTLVDRMYKKGLIERFRLTTDRRKVMVGLSEQGKELKTSLDEKMQSFESQLNQGISEDDRRILSEITQSIVRNKANNAKRDSS